ALTEGQSLMRSYPAALTEGQSLK
ncbi:hypothetical protein A2U01_0112341, partial [Trifolium medium]|nr:hypothetical protein [Trifolium medium]